MLTLSNYVPKTKIRPYSCSQISVYNAHDRYIGFLWIT